MHIAIFVDFHDSSVGGVQTSVRAQRKGLEQLGHKVTIFSPPPLGGKSVIPDPSVIIIPSVPFVTPNGFPMAAPTKQNIHFIEMMLDKIGPVDIIHAQTNMGIGIMAVRVAQKRSIPLVQTMHGRDDVFAQDTFPLPYLSTTALRLLHRKYVPHTSEVPVLNDSSTAHNAWRIMVNQAQAADQVVMPSHHFSAKFREHGVTKPIEVISNGVSDEVVATLSPKLKRVGKTGMPLRVIWCGRLSPEKRPIDSIEAISHIEGCQLDLYGNGPLKKTVQEYIDANGLSDRVHLKGKVSQAEVLEAMQEHDVLLYPSHGFDNQPMVIIEAVAAAIPVIYCDPDLTESMPSGGALLTDGVSIDSLTDALRILQKDPKKRHAMHKAMHEHRDKIVQSYHSKKMAALYKRVIKRK
jgi:glycosyltransferase involved in cell wall biosynthesis